MNWHLRLPLGPLTSFEFSLLSHKALNGHLRPLNSTWVHFLINCWLNVVTSVLNQVSLGPKKVPLRPLDISLIMDESNFGPKEVS